jgi:hypothetical protein
MDLTAALALNYTKWWFTGSGLMVRRTLYSNTGPDQRMM